MTADPKHLKLGDDFNFACHRGLDCYTSCCRDVNIFLTPNDVIRLKKALGLTSSEFLRQYTDLVVIPGRYLPLVQLKMNEENERKCFFLREGYGCIHYAHRPWACRMFPLDERGAGGYLVIAKPERCHGLTAPQQWTVKDWLMDQGATQSKEADGSYDALSGHEMLRSLDIENEQVQRMIITSLFDIDAFRDFVYNSTFLDRFELEPQLVEDCKTMDDILLDVGFAWVRFGLFGQKTLKLKEGADKAGKRK